MTEAMTINLNEERKQQVQAIMRALHEQAPAPRAQIHRAIDVLGLDVVQAVVAEAQQVEANGGLLRRDGQRRTLGGVFFNLLRDRCTPEQRKRVFWIAQRKPSPTPAAPPEPEPSEQAIQIATVIIQKLKLSVKKQKAVARDVDRVGVAEALAALRATLKVEQQGGRLDTDGKRMKALKVWRAVMETVNKTAV